MNDQSPGSISDELLWEILEDKLEDRQVCELIWIRLGYLDAGDLPWPAGPRTPFPWRDGYPIAPDFIGERPPTVMLTRSIPAAHKQLLKQELGFKGYQLNELVPRRTRRATAVSWLLAWRRQVPSGAESNPS
ncbi:MAG: DUF1823 family protein [Verrucomicrobia bacterium]|nr:DUF1823 family protein [Synechococcaceae bacterium WB6_1B_055]NBQ18880.1 DUF1823 family protein [Synechococcaceae bacterium WB5_2A_257]NBR44772.1 DUF1823 family protein [Synechococcaceae bacterium WB5_2B_268]NBS50493.1 DUF1823 family protein [Verrucomicrobiota bacterium]NBY60066.1 DUF1823 family protein [Synechococcaceae bacterium LLD_019]NCU91686.1 DUF1823 family protein [Synechococcaceae bacterium WB7_1B_046]NCY13400.1 DUF1823 family protein [Synechococcaceae bacterium WB8_1A_041]NDA751